MTTPASPARALHDILAALNSGAANSHVYSAWGKVAQADASTAKFATFHAETLGLFTDVVESVRALPEARRERYTRYYQQWWQALIYPRHDWASLKKVVDSSALDVLAGLADYVEERAGLPTQQYLRAPDVLQATVSYLVSEFEKDGSLRPAVRDSVLADLRHVLWLLDNVESFGIDHVVVATERATGQVLSAASRFGSGKLRAIGAGLLLALGLISQGTTDVNTIVSNVEHTVGVSQQAPTQDDQDVNVTINQVVKLCGPTRQIEGKQPQSADDDVVDAEVVGGDE